MKKILVSCSMGVIVTMTIICGNSAATAAEYGGWVSLGNVGQTMRIMVLTEDLWDHLPTDPDVYVSIGETDEVDGVNGCVFVDEYGEYAMVITPDALLLSDASLQALIAHELAHIVLGHIAGYGEDATVDWWRELEADAYSMQLLLAAGFDPVQVIVLQETLRRTTGVKYPEMEPDMSKRLAFQHVVLANL